MSRGLLRRYGGLAILASATLFAYACRTAPLTPHSPLPLSSNRILSSLSVQRDRTDAPKRRPKRRTGNRLRFRDRPTGRRRLVRYPIHYARFERDRGSGRTPRRVEDAKHRGERRRNRSFGGTGAGALLFRESESGASVA